VDAADFGELFAPFWKDLLLFVAARRLAEPLVIVLAPVEETVVNVSAGFQRIDQFPFLPLCGEKSVF